MAETASPPPVPPPIPPAVPPPAPRVVPPPLPSADLHLDREHPWPGLISFTEADHSFFFGREREVAELARVIRQKTLTVFFGKSGLGKSSIIRAGVSPILRGSEFMAIYVRLNHAEAAPPLEDQVEIAIEEALAKERIDAAKPVRAETLWEYFHKKGSEWWDPDNRLVKPVLIFDQFEELLTLGQSSPEQATRSAAFLAELEDLVENRPPEALRERFEAERGLARAYDLERVDYRVVLTLREDFLPDLEGLRERLRAIMFNRFRLLPMSGEQAMDVVLKPGGHLVDEDVAVRIVDFVSSSERSRLQKEVSRAQLAKRAIEPALLSVVLQELNSRRLQAGQDKITAELVGKTNPTEIFHDFYVRGLQGMDGAVREFIEDSLLTSSGARNRIAEEDALTRQGISADVVSKLIDRRIIQRETTGNTKWLELTHDTLADVVRTDRTEHQQQRQLQLAAAREAEARSRLHRTQRLAAGFAVLLVIAIFFLWLLAGRVESQATQTVAAIKKELDEPAPGGPDRVSQSVEALSADARRFFFLPTLKRERAKALGYAAQVLHFNGWIKEGFEYAKQAVEVGDGAGSDLISRANARYALGQGQLEEGQLADAETNFREAINLAEAAPEPRSVPTGGSDTDVPVRTRIHVLSQLGMAETKLRHGSRGEATKIADEVLAELSKAFADANQKHGISEDRPDVVIYKGAALRLKGRVQGLSDEIDDAAPGSGSNKTDFLEQADTIITRAAARAQSSSRKLDAVHPLFVAQQVALRDAEAETAYWRAFYRLSRATTYAQIAPPVRDAVDKGEKLFAMDQGNRRWQFRLAQDYRLQGMLLHHNPKQNGLALESFAKMANLATPLLRAERSWLANTYSAGIAVFYIADCLPDDSANTNAQAKKQAYDQSREMLEGLIASAPGHADYERSTALTIDYIGDEHVRQKQFDKAIAAYKDALAILTKVSAEAKQLPDFQSEVATIDGSIADTLLKLGGEENSRSAVDYANKAVEIRSALLNSRPSVANFSGLAQAYVGVGKAYLAQGKADKAGENYKLVVNIDDKAIETFGDNRSYLVQALQSKAQDLSDIASNWANAGAFEPAAATLEKAIESAKQAFKKDPLNAAIMSLLQGIKGEPEAPNWEKFCQDQLSNPKLSPNDKRYLKSISDLLAHIIPSEIPEGAGAGESLNWSILPLIPGSWHNLGPEEEETEIQYLASSGIKPPISRANVSRIRSLGLPFYEDANLFEVEVKGADSAPQFLDYIRTSDTSVKLRDFSSLTKDQRDQLDAEIAGSQWDENNWTKERVEGVRLDGYSMAVRAFNSKHRPILENAVSAAAYLRLFCTGLKGEAGTFQIFDNEGDLHWQAKADDKQKSQPKTETTQKPISEVRQDVQAVIYPLQIKSNPDGWTAKATVAYARAVFYALFALAPDGDVKMLDDDPAHGSDGKPLQQLPILSEQFSDGFRRVLASTTAAAAERLGELLNRSWQQLLSKDFAGALLSTEEGLKIDPDYLPLETNRAHALLFLGRTAEAEQIYRKYVGRKVDESGRTWEDEISNDFDKLEKDGLHHAEFARIRGILKSAKH